MRDELKKYVRKEPAFRDVKQNTYWRFSFIDGVVVLLANTSEDDTISFKEQ